MNLTRRTFLVETKNIHYIRSTVESYDGMALVSTLNAESGLLEVLIAPGCEGHAMSLIRRLELDEGVPMTQVSNSNASKQDADPNKIRALKSYTVLTMGCQMNEYDSDYAQRCLSNAGYIHSKDILNSDIVIINTCSVRDKATQKAISALGRVMAVKKRKPWMTIVFAGCVAQQQGRALLERFPALDLVLGTRRIHRIVPLIERLESTGERLVETGMEDEEILPSPPPLRREEASRVKGFITIMQGCDNYCSYCIVPYVRGREVSRSKEDILLEARHLVDKGAREITLLGQNVNSYFWREGSVHVDFSNLLRQMDSITGLKRLRFTTSHPKDLTQDLIRCFSELESLCGHIHLPFQAGSNEVLRRMNRGYTREEYFELVSRLREARPGIAITADVMVGFPGETEADFQDTMSLIQEVRFDGLYSFKYSDREGTKASVFQDKIDEKEKGTRLSALQDMQKRITLEKNRALEGLEIEVLVEGPGKKSGQFTGRSECNRVVNFNSDSINIGDFINVIIQHGRANSLFGVKTAATPGVNQPPPSA